jgi:hypothetical protein
MMTGNLFDLVFDGQSAITGRGAAGTPRHYVGTAELAPTDPAEYAGYAVTSRSSWRCRRG